jgi:glycosyltransferase involved in cell wall biosynthesis
MKIVIATYGFLPDIGGVSTNVSILAKGFVDAGHDVTVVTSARGPKTGFEYTVVRNAGPFQLYRLYADADILILSNLAIKLIYPLLLLRRKYALRHHSESAFRLSCSPLSLDMLRRHVRDRATHFMTSAYVGRRSGFKDWTVTHPFANPKHITEDVVRPAAERRDAVFVGRLEIEKGVLYLLDRLAEIRGTLGIEELRFIGDGSLRGEVERRISTGQAKGARYLGRLPLDQTAREMGQAAYALVPSLWEEPFGAVALEATAAGALVVLSNRGGLPETTGQVGFLFDPDDAQSWHRALADARRKHELHIASPEQWLNYRAAVTEHTAAYSPEAVVHKIISAMTDELKK